jgi:2-polyprenyl-3-methyl-5-hydroxy-6-metoxy-1,4-benzoquinol methylase
MNDGFYRAFEDRHRGSRDLIKARLAVYLPFIEPLLTPYPAADTIDLGCGRGEWLEILTGVGFKPIGVDLDSGMLAACHALDLIVELDDAIAYLSKLSGNSQTVVSAFHIVEHISFEQLQTLVAQAMRVLKPGGLLIMETPNPENIIVATRNFYLDPTHERPIPPMLLSFVAEYAGFSRVKTLRLQEPKELIKKGDVNLQDVFSGASPDYAVVAQKHASDDILALTDEPFSHDYGLSLENLLSRWNDRFDRTETKAQQAETKAQQAETKAQQAETKAQQAETASTNALTQLHAVYVSTSWRITAPIRKTSLALRALLQSLKKVQPALKTKIKEALHQGKLYVNCRPKLKSALLRVLNKSPHLKTRLIKLTSHSNAIAPIPTPIELVNLSPNARKIYHDLKIAIENKNKESH